MPTLVPTVRNSTQQALYPLTRRWEFVTRVSPGANGAEQRFTLRPPLASFALGYSSLLLADAVSQSSFFNAVKGMFDQQGQLTLDSVFNNLVVTSDTFETTTREPLLYDTEIKLRQTQNLAWAPAVSPPITFPTLSVGKLVQYPFTSGIRYITWVNDQETGPHYATSSYGGPFPNFPTSGLAYWRLSWELITEADLAILENFFLAIAGRLNLFSFTDPFGNTFPNCRLNTDTFEVRYLQGRDVDASTQGHLVSVSLPIAQIFVP